MATVSVLNTDRGIHTVTHTGKRPGHGDAPDYHVGAVPDFPALKTAQHPPGQTDLDTYMVLQLCPLSFSPAALAPAQFSVLLEQARHDLQSAATRNPDKALIINRAVRLLGDDIDLRSLMTMYRNALLPG